MTMKGLTLGIRILFVMFVLLCNVMWANAAVAIENLQVEYRKTPMGIDVAQPRFSWQMATTKGERGYAQTAYRIEVKDPKGSVVWDTQRVEGAVSIGIKYAGRAKGIAFIKYEKGKAVYELKSGSYEFTITR